VVRGDVNAITLPKGRGRVQHGRRYVVIVQADNLMALSTVVICPTSTSAPAASFHPEIDLDGQKTQVLCEMVGAVEARNLGDFVGHLNHDELKGVEDALSLGLNIS
jgi:mRNA interferase MazF